MTIYQVGGSLSYNAVTYVKREADTKLLSSLKQGEFCYVLNSRQMGKSSLLVKTRHQLKQEGYLCPSIDLTTVGSENVTPLQWYKGIIAELWRGLTQLEDFNFKGWWSDEQDFSLLQRLSRFVGDVLLPSFPQEKIVIFVDEIDSTLSLPFPVDDFFAWIRFCYNQRAINSDYNRLNFAIFGVATPADLIRDKTRTPFNIGTAIELTGFTLQEATPLLQGLQLKVGNPQAILQEILNWTGGQPFLTQKLCKLIVTSSQEDIKPEVSIPLGMENFWVSSLVQTRIVHNWESQDEPEHLKTIRDRLFYNEQRLPRLLSLYLHLLDGQVIPVNDSREQSELVLSGLVVKHRGRLQIKNPIYQEVFNPDWTEYQLQALRPYSQAFNAWLESEQSDESRLLRGNALAEAKNWAQGKSLSDLDYQFLAKSEESDRARIQQALELEKAQAITKTATLQRRLLSVISLAFLIASTLGITAFWQSRKASQQESEARKSEIKALISSSDAEFTAQQKLDALISAIKAKRRLEALKTPDTALSQNVQRVLQQGIYWIHEKNRLSGHDGPVLGVDYRQDGQLIATASADSNVRLWKPDGTLVKTLENEGTLYEVEFHPDSSRPLLAVTKLNGKVCLWDYEAGKIIQSFQGHDGAVWDVDFSPDGNTLLTGSADQTLKLWQLDGTLLQTFTGHQEMVWDVDFSPDGQTIASAGFDATVKLWSLDGTVKLTFTEHQEDVWSIAFSPQGDLLASGEWSETVKLWQPDGTVVATLEGHKGGVDRLAFSPDGQKLGVVGKDQTVRLWRRDGRLGAIFRGHSAGVRDLAFSQTTDWQLVSGGEDGTARLWQPTSPLVQEIRWDHKIWDIAFLPNSKYLLIEDQGGNAVLLDRQENREQLFLPEQHFSFFGFDVSPDGQLIATTSSDGTIHLWHPDGTPVQVLGKHDAQVWDAAFSPDGELVVSVSDDKTVKLWRVDGTLVKTLTEHQGRVHRVVFHPHGQRFATTGADGTVKVWSRSGELLQSIEAHSGVVFGLDATSEYIASASVDGTVKLWDWEGELVHTLDQHNSGVVTVAFSPDGQMLASGSVDQTAKLWTVEGEVLKTLYGFGGGVWSVRFSPDGETLATGTDDQMLALWNMERVLNVDELTYACNWVRDYLRNNQGVEGRDRNLCTGID
ncbi:AAA-like domain-containing protein [Spirulina sp. CS-785/01]|uniref:WD40 domain-containing protein n=1 Tax=Spirulina sp. CS-785/01 TaxID=3021716 RepID=UPI00232F7990|nr:AAA-like domain-containing protein [Spirulina sp. CS-785/01]MDB9313230.1 AAA-like domain-containing protein [Spirulina sp. CS-785/01]